MVNGDANDIAHLQNDPFFKDVLQGNLALQPTIFRFKNSFDKAPIFKRSYAWVDRYVLGLKWRDKVIIDSDATDYSTYGNQQLSMYNGYYGKFMLNVERIWKLALLVTIAFVWCYNVGIYLQQNVRPVKTKKHGKSKRALFKYVLDYIANRLLNALKPMKINIIKILLRTWKVYAKLD